MTKVFVELKIENNTAIITIDNPPVNALSNQIVLELEQAIEAVEQNTELQSLIITGAGTKAFVGGADIKQFLTMTPESCYETVKTGQRVFERVSNLEIPVIAAIEGFALGGGCELALACDIRIAGEKAKFGLPEVGLGLIPGYGGSQRLPRILGSGKAYELIFSGDIIDASEAYRIGLVNNLVPNGEALGHAQAFVSKIQSKAPLAIKAAKKAIKQGIALPLDEAFELEARVVSDLCSTEDQKEGARAFLAKEKPKFQGK
ncbi:hypothetical protein GNT69_16055 [Bacillus sp. B15-48]|nr:hypothetical protein [Bacillus sp. B15-48]